MTVDQRGYTVHPDILTSSDIESTTAALENLPTRSRAGVRHLMAHPAVAALAHDPRLLAMAGEALGTPAIPYRATLFDKSPGSNWLVAWHQDTALPLRVRRDTPGWGPWSVKNGVVYAHAPARALETVAALRVHLDDSLAGNGPLRVLPGSHLGGVLSDAGVATLVSDGRPQECLVGRGGVLVMRPLLVHASSRTVTPMPRRVLHIEYAGSLHIDRDLDLRVA